MTIRQNFSNMMGLARQAQRSPTGRDRKLAQAGLCAAAAYAESPAEDLCGSGRWHGRDADGTARSGQLGHHDKGGMQR